MPAQLFDLAAHDVLAETIGDAALAGVLCAKPAEDEIPAAVWWLLAETLRTSVTIRHAVDRPVPPPGTDLRVLIAEAMLLTDAAMAELAETTGALPVPLALPEAHDDGSPPTATRPGFDLQLSVMLLARLLVTNRVTTPRRLANTLAAHLRALSRIELESLRAT